MPAAASRLKTTVNLPNWEMTEFNPNLVNSSALSATCTPDNTQFHPQYRDYMSYLLAASSHWVYNIPLDGFAQASSPPIAPATFSSLKFAGAYGFEGRVLAATANSITIPHYSGDALKGFEVRIISGTGKGQQRMVTDIAPAVIADSGVVTAATALVLTDSTKAWAINQWAGFQVRITFGTGVSQVRRILYNDATSLTFVDVNRLAVDYNANPMAPLPAFSATAGVQSIYAIESAIATVESNWTVTPDETSRFRFLSGAEFLFSGAAAAPFYTLQIRDIVSDTWYIRTATTNIFAALGTDGCIERTSENASIWDNGIALGTHTTTTLQNTAKEFVINEHAGRWIFIQSGTNAGTIKQITSNTVDTITVSSAWGGAPTNTSRYKIVGFDAGTATAGSTTTLTDSTKAWTTNRWGNYVLRVLSGTGVGQTAAIKSNTGTVLTFYKPLGTALDATSIYSIEGDKDNVYLFNGGAAAVGLHSFEADMATLGRSVDDGLARFGSAQYGEFPPCHLSALRVLPLQKQPPPHSRMASKLA